MAIGCTHLLNFSWIYLVLFGHDIAGMPGIVLCITAELSLLVSILIPPYNQIYSGDLQVRAWAATKAALRSVRSLWHIGAPLGGEACGLWSRHDGGGCRVRGGGCAPRSP